MQEYVTTKNLSTPICLDMIFYVLHMKLQYIVTPFSAPEYCKYDICQPFITGMCWDMSCIHSHPQSHIASHCITPGDVHFSLGVSGVWRAGDGQHVHQNEQLWNHSPVLPGPPTKFLAEHLYNIVKHWQLTQKTQTVRVPLGVTHICLLMWYLLSYLMTSCYVI